MLSQEARELIRMQVEDQGSIRMFQNDHAITARPRFDDRSHGRCIVFGPFRLYPGAREIWRDGIPLALGSRALDILIALTECAGEVVSHKELTRRVWRGLVVGAGSLRVHIAALRKALGTGNEECRYIANIPGQGYCFVAPIERLEPIADGSGKRGLAIEAIAEVLRRFTHGCRLVELPASGDALSMAGHPAGKCLLLVMEDAR
jgi:DNA-binding winged helix-turn-helix (wHTH) protein